MDRFLTIAFLTIFTTSILFASHHSALPALSSSAKSDNLKQILQRYENQQVYPQGLETQELSFSTLIEIGDDYITLMTKEGPQKGKPMHIPMSRISFISPQSHGVTIWFSNLR